MRRKPSKELERHRVRIGTLKSDPAYGNNGAFTIPLSPTPLVDGEDLGEAPKDLLVLVVGDMGGWEHVSVHVDTNDGPRVPTWHEMCRVKNMFWKPDECVVQYHPPKQRHRNQHETTLHLWRQVGHDIPLPPLWMV